MSKEITKAVILQEIQDKLKLREFAPSKFLFDETVVPVYNIEPHLEEWWGKYATKSITATGGQNFFYVPSNERWHLSRYDVVFMTGAYTVAGVYTIRAHTDPAGTFTYLDLKAAQNTSYHVQLSQDVVLESKDGLYINIDGYTSPGDLRLYIDYMREEIR